MTELAMNTIRDMLENERGHELALAYIQGRLIECSEQAAINARRRRKGGDLPRPLKKAILLAALTAIADELDETIRGLEA